MIVRQSVADVLENHVTFALECIDRMYLNAYVPSLQTGSGFVWFLKTQLGCRVPSTAMIAPQSRAFAEAFEHFAAEQGVDLVTFKRGERKDDVLQRYLAAFTAASPAGGSQLFADNTRDAIERGCRVALAALVDRTCAELARRTHAAPRLYCTGGAVDEVLPYVLATYERVPDLVLRGLARIADATLER